MNKKIIKIGSHVYIAYLILRIFFPNIIFQTIRDHYLPFDIVLLVTFVLAIALYHIYKSKRYMEYLSINILKISANAFYTFLLFCIFWKFVYKEMPEVLSYLFFLMSGIQVGLYAMREAIIVLRKRDYPTNLN